MFAAYIDDSGSHPESRHMLLAGYLSHVALWQQLSSAWQRILQGYGLKSFHMTEAEAGASPYDRFTLQERWCLIGRLSRLVHAHVMSGLCSHLPLGAYEAHVKPAVHADLYFSKRVKHPYYFSFKHALTGIESLCSARKIPRDQVRIVFATQPKLGHGARDAARKQFEGAGFTKPEFQESSVTPPLQAADMLAWCMYRSLTHGPDAIELRHAPLTFRVSTASISESGLKRVGALTRAIGEAERRRASAPRPNHPGEVGS
jgi:hypothetical protein